MFKYCLEMASSSCPLVGHKFWNELELHEFADCDRAGESWDGFFARDRIHDSLGFCHLHVYSSGVRLASGLAVRDVRPLCRQPFVAADHYTGVQTSSANRRTRRSVLIQSEGPRVELDRYIAISADLPAVAASSVRPLCRSPFATEGPLQSFRRRVPMVAGVNQLCDPRQRTTGQWIALSAIKCGTQR